MDNNSNTQQPKLFRYQAVYSLILGIISIILPYIIIAIQGTGISHGSALVFLLGMIVAVICAIIGLILGIKGLKSDGKKLAIAGITVCAIGLIILIWDLLGWMMAGGTIYL